MESYRADSKTMNRYVGATIFDIYVVNALSAYLKNENREILQIKDRRSYFDAFLPEGIDEIREPLFLKIMSSYSSSKVSMQGIRRCISIAKEKKILVVLKKSAVTFQGVLKENFTEAENDKFLVWSAEEFNERVGISKEKYCGFLERPIKILGEEVVRAVDSVSEKKEKQNTLKEELKKQYKAEDVVLFLGLGGPIKNYGERPSKSRFLLAANKIHAGRF